MQKEVAEPPEQESLSLSWQNLAVTRSFYCKCYNRDTDDAIQTNQIFLIYGDVK